jgi:hypothetical protein
MTMSDLEMSKWFITTARRFTKEIKVKKQLSKCPFFIVFSGPVVGTAK